VLVHSARLRLQLNINAFTEFVSVSLQLSQRNLSHQYSFRIHFISAYKSQSSYNFKPTQLRKAHPVQSETRKSFSTRGNINGTLAPKARGFAPSSTPVRTSSATKCEYNREESLLAKGDGYQQKQQVRGRKKSDGSYQMSLLEQKKQQWAKERGKHFFGF
jgi:hypothetical protein